MKTHSLVKFFEVNGLQTEVNEAGDISIYKNKELMIFINAEEDVINTDTKTFKGLPLITKRDFYKVIHEYVETPKIEREKNELYLVQLSGLDDKGWSFANNYLNYSLRSGKYLIFDKLNGNFKSAFTKEEIENFPDFIKQHKWDYTKVEE